MNKFYFLAFLGIVCFLPTTVIWSQSIENVRTTFDGEKVSITYDLIYSDPNQEFNVSIYGSHDNFAKPLSFVMGSQGLGDKVLPGKNIVVKWDAKSELPADFNQDVVIRIKAYKVAPLIKLTMKPFYQSSYKKGKTIDIKWLGGNPTDKVKLQLIRGNIIDSEIVNNHINDQQYTWTIPKNTTAGKNYIIRISNVNNPTELANSQIFAIKVRTPFIVKVLPFLAAGAVVYLLTKPTTTTPEADLPGLTITPN